MRRSATLLLAAVLLAGCAGSGESPSAAPSAAVSADPSAGPSTVPPTAPAATPTASTEPAATGGIELAKAETPRLATTPADASAAGRSVNAFGMGLYQRLVDADPEAGVVLSPASIALALGMARAGAKGDTAREMDGVTRLLTSDANAAWMAALDQSLNAKTASVIDAMGNTVDVTLRSANQAFAQRGYPIEEAYLATIAERFGAGLGLVDFTGAPEEARQAINGWVADETEDRILELLASGSVDAQTRLVLVNAIYLKAPWLVPFLPEATAEEPFTRLDGTTADVPMMRTGGTYDYAEGDGWKAVQLPYAGNGLAMLLIVPDDLRAFERTLGGGALDAIADELAPGQVSIALPRFSVETSADLGELLAGLGMPTAFDPDAADFSGMTDAERLFIGAVVHQANIDVDEKGTEAAAATAVEMAAGAAPGDPKEIRADRPFIFAVRDLASGAAVFLGRVTEP